MLAACATLPPKRHRPPRWRPPRSPWPLAVLLALALELAALPLRRHGQAPCPVPEPEGAVLVTTETPWTMGEKPPRRLIPPKPLPEWEKVPCREPWMVPLNGACWAKVEKARPPCTMGLYEYEGGCYAPITKGNRPPTSLHR